jgi:hypothetical protein
VFPLLSVSPARWDATSRVWVVQASREEDAKKYFHLHRIESFEQHPNPPDDEIDYDQDDRVVRQRNNTNDENDVCTGVVLLLLFCFCILVFVGCFLSLFVW